jgi:site-specific DNA recombinase
MREINRLVDGIAKGLGDPAVLGPRSTELYHQKLALMDKLNQADQPVEAIALHPKVLSRYEEQLCHLQEALAASLGSGDTEGANLMRELVESVTVFPHETRTGGVIIELKGKLNALLGDRAYPNGLRAASSSQPLLRVGGLMVAEERLELPTRGL